MKLLTLIFLLYLNSCMGQYPIQRAYYPIIDTVYSIFTVPESVYLADIRHDTISRTSNYLLIKTDSFHKKTHWISYKAIRIEPDTLPCIILVSDTQAINGKTDTHVYWVKGYKVVEDFDTYYLDISKKRFGRSVIIWLDQNN